METDRPQIASQDELQEPDAEPTRQLSTRSSLSEVASLGDQRPTGGDHGEKRWKIIGKP